MDLMTPATATKIDDVIASEILAQARSYGLLATQEHTGLVWKEGEVAKLSRPHKVGRMTSQIVGERYFS